MDGYAEEESSILRMDKVARRLLVEKEFTFRYLI